MPVYGTVTFLFTDIEDSTRLWETQPARMGAALARHDALCREVVGERGGGVVKTTGDGMYTAFEDPFEALSAAIELQRAIQALARESDLALKIRCGLHSGAAERRDGDYFGPAVNCAARVMSLARGGQTLLTHAARAALGDTLPNAATLEAHGHYRLKGIAEPVEIFEIGFRNCTTFVPPEDTEKAVRVVRSDDGWRPVREVRHNLTRERDAFVGRAVDLAAVAARLDTGTRLLTVLGPGGTGKTRLVRRYAWNWLGDWPGGVYFCDLSDARTLEAAFFVVAGALDVPLGKSDPGVQLGHAIATRGRCLVILDNFEQIVEHAEASVARWLDRAPDVAFLVTSRERLHVGGEDVLPLEPLSIDVEGVELFALRARTLRPDFAITPANRALVRRIVALLDGLPLAIELAAARIRVMSPAQLLERLSDRFSLLAHARSPADRQATLRNAIDWSWKLLLPWEQAALAQCSVFEGGFTLDAAEGVIDLSVWPDAPSIVDAVQALVDKSLLRTWVPVEQVRHELEEPYFGMYLTIHAYAAEKLAASGTGVQRAAEERHGRHFARCGTDDRLKSLYQRDGGVRRRALTLELGNLVTACRRAVVHGHGDIAVATLRAAWEALMTQGPFDLVIGLGAEVDTVQEIEPSLRAAALTVVGRAAQAAGRLEHASAVIARALELARAANDPAREAEVLTRLAAAERQQGRMEEARHHLEQALALRDALGEADGVALVELGIVQRQTGTMPEALATYQRAIAIDRELGNADAEARAVNSLAIVHAEQGRFDEARKHFEVALALSRELGDRRQEGLVLGNLGSLNVEQGRLAIGREQCEAALAVHRDTGERVEEGNVLINLGLLDQSQGRIDEARNKLRAALAITRETGNRRGEGVVLGMLGALECEQGRIEHAQAHYDQALAIHRAVGNRRYAGMVLGQLGDLLTQQERLDEARALLAEGEVELRAVDEKLELASLVCVRGRLELAAGEPARALAMLAEVDSGARALGLDADSKLWKEIAALREAIGAGRSTAR